MTQPLKRLLVVDDNAEIRDLLSAYLEKHGFSVCQAANGEELRERFANESYDLIVLDIMMPGEDGLSLCAFLRANNGPPVILLTAMSEDTDTIVGLEMGADDYVTKPFTPRVLLARIKAVLRRAEAKEDNDEGRKSEMSPVLRFAGWSLDLNQRHLQSDDGVLVPLSNAEFVLLRVFVEHPQQVLSRDRLLTLTKGREAEPFDRSVDNQVSRLRKKLEMDPQNPMVIKTVWGGGYMFAEAVTR